MYRLTEPGLDVLVGHMGGPYWAKKDAGAWSIPKGLVDADDTDEYATACREFSEEMGVPVPPGRPIDLGVFRQRTGKEIHIWAVEGDVDSEACVSNTFTMEWPPRSGRMQEFPEMDRAGWWSVDAAKERVVAGQIAVLDALCTRLASDL